MSSVQKCIDHYGGKGAYKNLKRQDKTDWPPAWVEPAADPTCRCAKDTATGTGFITVDNRVRLCGYCDLGHWRAAGLGFKPYKEEEHEPKPKPKTPRSPKPRRTGAPAVDPGANAGRPAKHLRGAARVSAGAVRHVQNAGTGGRAKT